MARQAAGFEAVLAQDPPVSRHCPSATVLFSSAAEACGPKAMGLILTGMGEDGAEGLLRMRQAGAWTLGQDEATSVVYGMPRVAWQRGAVIRQAPLQAMAQHLVAWATES